MLLFHSIDCRPLAVSCEAQHIEELQLRTLHEYGLHNSGYLRSLSPCLYLGHMLQSRTATGIQSQDSFQIPLTQTVSLMGTIQKYHEISRSSTTNLGSFWHRIAASIAQWQQSRQDTHSMPGCEGGRVAPARAKGGVCTVSMGSQPGELSAN